mgnify:CR=1 FL=1
MKGTLGFIQNRIVDMAFMLIVSTCAFLYYEKIPASNFTLCIAMIIFLSILTLVDKLMTNNEVPDDYSIPEELDRETKFETSTYDNNDGSYMAYLHENDSIGISEKAVRDYNEGREEVVLAALTHEEGHVSRRHIDNFEKYAVLVFPVVCFALISHFSDGFVLGVCMGVIILIISVLLDNEVGKHIEKMADRYALERGHIEGLIEMYDAPKSLENIRKRPGYPTARERKITIGEYVKENREEIYSGDAQ